jgi:S-adenosylmethionine:tRNA ribosyltransferase-isomerase
MRTADFDFELPPELIADEPARPRDAARLLDMRDTLGVGYTLADRHVRDLPDLLNPGDLLVYNDTRVIPARLTGRRGEVKVEATLHKREGADVWHVFAKPGKRLRVGDTIVFAPDLSAEVMEKREAGDIALRFSVAGGELMAALHRYGVMPLPPYIRRPDGASARDAEDYQTVFAAREGAVAAPTAGLHFTPELLARLEARGIRRVPVTLHVGAGTFLPVKVDDIRDHRMHAARFPRRPRGRSRRRRVQGAGSFRSAPRRCACWKRRRMMTERLRPSAAIPTFSSPPDTASRSWTFC